MPPIRELDAGGIDYAMPLVGVFAVYGVGDGYSLVAVKGAALAVGGAGKVGEFGNGATGVWGKVVVIFSVKHLITPLLHKHLIGLCIFRGYRLFGLCG